MGDINRDPTGGETLPHLLSISAARSRAQVCFIESSGASIETSWQEIFAEASRCAAALVSRGIRPGDRVAVLGLTSRQIVESIFGILLAGGTVVMLPLPLRINHLDLFRKGTLVMVETARAQLVLSDALHIAFCGTPEPGRPPVVLVDDLFQGGPEATLPAVAPADLAILQFTSGSTQRPKAVALSHASICSNCFAIKDAVRFSGQDHLVTWLPLYHDMGLIGGLFVPMNVGMSMTLMPAQKFALHPPQWMRTVSQRRATVVVAPNFAYALAGKILRSSEGLDLSSLRVALCGAEPIVVQNLAAFLEAGQRFGLSPEVMVPCYGLAEASLAVTFAPLHRPLLVDPVDEHRLETEGRAVPAAQPETAKSVVSVGRPLRGVSVRVVDQAGQSVAERIVGEVRVASCSLMRGYEGPADEGATIEDGWLATGDLGYIADGELFICGRKKDLLKINGRNIWPDDVEHIVQGVPGVRKGNACAFGLTDERGHEVIIIVAEVSKDARDPTTLPGDILSAVTEHIEIAPRHVLVLEPGTLPKTTSGKLARGPIRELYRKRALPVMREAGQGVPS